MITEVESETTQPPAKMAAARSWKRPGPDSSLEDSALLTPGSLPVKLTQQLCNRISVCCFKPPRMLLYVRAAIVEVHHRKYTIPPITSKNVLDGMLSYHGNLFQTPQLTFS